MNIRKDIFNKSSMTIMITIVIVTVIVIAIIIVIIIIIVIAASAASSDTNLAYGVTVLAKIYSKRNLDYVV